MNHSQRKLTVLFLGIGLLLSALIPANAQQQPQRKPELEAMILLADGKRQRGFIQDTSKEGLLFALVERGPGNGYYWDTQVTAVAFDNSNDIMRDAKAAFTQANYEEAATKCGQIADGYANMAWVPNGFAAEARYYHIESLRILGRYKEIGPLLETPTGQAINSKLGDFYQSQHELNKLWAQVGAEQWDAVKAAVEARQKPQVGSQELLPTPVFQQMPSHEMAQMTFIRGKLYEKAGEKGKALSDFYQTFTLTFANNPELALPAMEAVMAIHKENPKIADEKNKTVLRQMQSMAYLYKNAFGGGEIQPQFAAFSLKPELPKPPVVKEKEEEVPPPADPKKMEPKGEDAAAPAPKPAGDAEEKKDGADPKKDGADEPAKTEPEPEPKPKPAE